MVDILFVIHTKGRHTSIKSLTDPGNRGDMSRLGFNRADIAEAARLGLPRRLAIGPVSSPALLSEVTIQRRLGFLLPNNLFKLLIGVSLTFIGRSKRFTHNG